MVKKTILFMILTTALVYTLSCSTIRYQDMNTLNEFREDKIVSIQKKSGENVYFVESSGVIHDDRITAKKTTRKEIHKDDIQLLTTLFHQIGQPYKYTLITKDGQEYNLRSYKELDDDILWVELDEEISIPLSEVQEIEIQKLNQIKGGIWGFGVGFIIGGSWEGFRIFARAPENRGSVIQGIPDALFKSIGVGALVHHVGAFVSARDKYVLRIPADSTTPDLDMPADTTRQEFDIRRIRLF